MSGPHPHAKNGEGGDGGCWETSGWWVGWWRKVRLWRNITKLPAYNTVEEDNLITSYGENPDAGPKELGTSFGVVLQTC